MTALIALSGGVDSSVAAQLMLAEGADCIGCTMLLYEAPELAAVRGVPAAQRTIPTMRGVWRSAWEYRIMC